MKKGLVFFTLLLLCVDALSIWSGIHYHNHFRLVMIVGLGLMCPILMAEKAPLWVAAYILGSVSAGCFLIVSLICSTSPSYFLIFVFGIFGLLSALAAIALYNEAINEATNKTFLEKVFKEDEICIRQEQPRHLVRIK